MRSSLTAAVARIGRRRSTPHTPHRTVQLGIFGNIGRIQALTGQQTQVGHVIVGWGQDTFDQLWPLLGPMPMLGFSTARNGVGADHAAVPSREGSATVSCSN